MSTPLLLYYGWAKKTITKTGTDNAQTSTQNSSTNTNTSNSTTDNRFSDTPQDQIDDVKDGKYVSNYSYIQADVETNGSATNNGTGTNDRNYTETIVENDNDNTYFKIQNEMASIFEMIFKDLDCLFFSIV